MGSISLIAIPDQESDLAKLHWDIGKREQAIARDKMRSDPKFAAKVMQLLSE